MYLLRTLAMVLVAILGVPSAAWIASPAYADIEPPPPPPPPPDPIPTPTPDPTPTPTPDPTPPPADPAPAPEPPKEPAKVENTRGKRAKIDGAKMVTAAVVCLGLNQGLDAAAKLPRPSFARGMVRGIMCNGVAALIPVSGFAGGLVGGIFGKVVYETTIGVDGILTNLVNDTFKCQPNDRRERCAIWVQQNPTKVKKKVRGRKKSGR